MNVTVSPAGLLEVKLQQLVRDGNTGGIPPLVVIVTRLLPLDVMSSLDVVFVVATRDVGGRGARCRVIFGQSTHSGATTHHRPSVVDIVHVEIVTPVRSVGVLPLEQRRSFGVELLVG